MLCSIRFWRLYRVRNVYRNKSCIRFCSTSDLKYEQKEEDLQKPKDLRTLLPQYKDKIIFNSYLEQDKLRLGYFKYHLKMVKQAKSMLKREYEEKSLPALPLALQYYVDKDRLLKEESEEEVLSEPEKQLHLPFGQTSSVEIKQEENAVSENVAKSETNDKETEFKTKTDKWMTNYEYFDDSLLDSENDSEWTKMYGTPDPTVPVSRVPCGGCGALLHCSDTAIPGYLPSEIFVKRTDDQLRTMECQRCHFLKEYNIALDVTVQPEEFEKLLQSIRYLKSLVILMIDLLDFPCSIWPGIVDIIGPNRPLIVVGNKVDLLPGDSVNYLKRVKECLLTEINKTRLGEANIKHVALISAKTGYGVEDLISALFKLWLYKGDVFLVGCTNVGKSSLFNALLQSDYCKVHAVDIVKRATISRWPGTTLHLLKFPINRPSGWKIYHRGKRLKSERKLVKLEKELREAHHEGKINAASSAPALIGRIGRTFTSLEGGDHHALADRRYKLMTLDEKDDLFKQSKWLYDTPGVVHPDQILSLLTTEELLLTIPKSTIRPRTFYMYEGQTIFIGGLARVDVVGSAHPCRLTVFCSEELPVTVTGTRHADDVYAQFLGTEVLRVPGGGARRLRRWPGLRRGPDLRYTGEGPKRCCGDAVLAAPAWLAVTAKGGSECVLRAWSPEGRGLHRRQPSLLPYAVNLKGKRIRDTPAYTVGDAFSEDS